MTEQKLNASIEDERGYDIKFSLVVKDNNHEWPEKNTIAFDSSIAMSAREQAEEWGREIVNYFNTSLKRGELKREYVRIDDVILEPVYFGEDE